MRFAFTMFPSASCSLSPRSKWAQTPEKGAPRVVEDDFWTLCLGGRTALFPGRGRGTSSAAGDLTGGGLLPPQPGRLAHRLRSGLQAGCQAAGSHRATAPGSGAAAAAPQREEKAITRSRLRAPPAAPPFSRSSTARPGVLGCSSRMMGSCGPGRSPSWAGINFKKWWSEGASTSESQSSKSRNARSSRTAKRIRMRGEQHYSARNRKP